MITGSNYVLRKPLNGIGIVIDVYYTNTLKDTIRLYDVDKIYYSQTGADVTMYIGEENPKIEITSAHLFGYDSGGFIQSLNGISAKDLQELVDSNYCIHHIASSSSVVEVTSLNAVVGNSLTSSSFIGKNIRLIAFNGLSYSTGFILSGSTITFNDGTSFVGGESVVVLYS